MIGGYLGAGKTTLLNHILASTSERIAVLVNDFGEINIDAALIESATSSTMTLTNGCICCSLVDGLSAAFDAMLELDPAPDRIVIEASGVADPAGVSAFAHGPGLQLDATVVVVDSETIQATIDDAYVGDTVSSQLAAADIIVANKADLADVQLWLTGRYPTTLITPATNAVVAPELLFGHAPTPRAAASHEAADIFESWQITRDRPLPRAVIERYLHSLPDRVVRAKGIVWSSDRPDRQLIVHRVGRRVTVRVGPPWPGEESTSLALIGLLSTP